MACSFWLTNFYFESSVAIIISLSFSMWLTGAFHEDGLADTFDGIGGGWTPEKRLAIMKDSRLGTYGTVALVMSLLLKFALLNSLQPMQVILGIILAHSLSRFMATTLIFTESYVTETGSKSKPVATTISGKGLMFSFMFPLLPAILIGELYLFLCLPLLIGVRQYLVWKFRLNVGGYTGDLLGGAQQVFEIVIYLFLAVLWRSY